MSNDNSSIETSFEDCLSLYNIVGNRKIVENFLAIKDSYHNQKMDGLKPKVPSIILSGDNTEECRKLAIAFGNSFGNNFKEGWGQTIQFGGEDIFEFFQDAKNCTTFFLNSCECLSPFSQSVIYKLLKTGTLEVAAPFEIERRIIKVEFSKDNLLILSTANKKRILSQLLNAVDYTFDLVGFSKYEIFLLLKQHCQYLNIKYRSDEVLKRISQYSDCQEQAVRTLKMATAIMGADRKDVLCLSQVSKALVFSR